MGCKNWFDEGSKYMKIAAILMFATLILHLVAMASPHWAKSDPDESNREEHIGLFMYCVDPIGGDQQCNKFVDIITGDWIKAIQGFSILALFALLGATALLILLVFVPDFEENNRLKVIGIAVVGCGALFKLIEVSGFGSTYQEYFKNKDPGVWGEIGVLDWAFGVGVASFFCCVATVVVMVLEMGSGGKDY